MVCPNNFDGPIVLAKSKINMVLLAARVLEDTGFNVLEVTSADAVLSHLESRSDIRVVIADDNLAGCLSGRELSHFVKRRWPGVDVILLESPKNAAWQVLPEAALWGQYSFSALVDKIFEIAKAGEIVPRQSG
jgi:DNA-binding NtrC family response regulator